MKYEYVIDTVTNNRLSIDDFEKDNVELFSHRHSLGRFISEQDGIILSFVDKVNKRNYKSGKHGEVRAHFRKTPYTIKQKNEIEDKIKQYEESIHNYVSKLIVDGEIRTFEVSNITVDCLGKDKEIYDNNIIEILKILSEDSVVFEDSLYRPDVYVLARIDGTVQPLAIEIMYSHKVDDNKLKYYKEHNINCIELDITSVKGEIKLKNKSTNITEQMSKYLKEIISSNKYNNNYFLNSVTYNIMCNVLNTYCKKIVYSPFAMGNGYLCDSKRFQRNNPDRNDYWPDKSIMIILYNKRDNNNKHYLNYLEVDWEEMHNIRSLDYDNIVKEKITINKDKKDIINPLYEHLIYAKIDKSDMTKSVYYVNTTDKNNIILKTLSRDLAFKFLFILEKIYETSIFKEFNSEDIVDIIE